MATSKSQVDIDLPREIKDVYFDIDKHIMNTWQEEYNKSKTGTHYKTIEPNVTNKIKYSAKLRRKDVTITRLRLGHCSLNHYLYRIKKHATGLCSHCNVQETIEHFLMNCPHYNIKKQIGTLSNTPNSTLTIQTMLSDTIISNRLYEVLITTGRKIWWYSLKHTGAFQASNSESCKCISDMCMYKGMYVCRCVCMYIYAYIQFCKSSFARLVFMFSRERRLANKNSEDNKDEKITMSTKNIYKLWKQQSWKRFLPVFALWKGFSGSFWNENTNKERLKLMWTMKLNKNKESWKRFLPVFSPWTGFSGSFGASMVYYERQLSKNWYKKNSVYNHIMWYCFWSKLTLA